MTMRRALVALAVFVLASVGPTVVEAAACAMAGSSCCKAVAKSETALTRGACCPTTCFDTARDTDDATAAASAFRTAPERTAEPAGGVAVPSSDPREGATQAPSPPPTARRLATLSVLLI